MKYVFICLLLTGCNLPEEVIECDGEVVPYLVENIVTGEQFIQEQCKITSEIPKGCRMAICKQGTENCPVICEEE